MQPTPIDPLARKRGDQSAEAKLLRIIRQLQQDAAAYLPGEITKDEFIDRVLRAIDGPEWREVEAIVLANLCVVGQDDMEPGTR